MGKKPLNENQVKNRVNKLDSKRGEHEVFIIHEVNDPKGTKCIPKG